MAKKNKAQPLSLFRKTLGFTLQSLIQQRNELISQIEKKEATVKTFRAYLTEYEHSTSTGASKSIQQLINHQSFLNQIAKTLLLEQEALDILMHKKDALSAELNTKTQQIETIDEALKQAEKNRLEDAENRMEQVNLDQWNHHNHHQKKTLD